jgi:uncharacterized protein YbjT (DUF2867 family)
MLKQSDIVTVLGGSGFLGNYVVYHLAKKGVRIKVISRSAATSAKQAAVSGAVGQIATINMNLTDPAQLEQAIKNSDYVINLVGTFTSSGPNSLSLLHVSLAENIAKLCQEHNIKKLVHISALGIEKAVGKSRYAQTKLHGELLVIENFDRHVILKPGIMFGPEDNFINLLAKIIRIFPFIPLIGNGKNKVQPVYVDDVARAVVKALELELTKDQNILELAGPKQYTMKQLWKIVASILKKTRIYIQIPFSVAKIQAFFLQMLPNPILTIEQVQMLKYDNTLSEKNGFEVLGIKPQALETLITKYWQQ